MLTAATTWKLTLSYDGAPFHGWQVQPGRPTVQGTLAAAIQRVTGETVLPQGSGRTDAGVHARGQVASFTLAVPIPATNLQHALNRALPPSIRVLAAELVPASFHARHSAVRKSYEYRIFERRLAAVERVCSPFLAPYMWDCRWALQLDPMQAAAALLAGTHDFTSFAASDPDRAQRLQLDGGVANAPNPVKTIDSSMFTREDDQLIYRVSGSGFLHHMVRNLVGTLVEVGRGALQPADIPAILERRDRAAAGPTAPAQGLYLRHVEYPHEYSADLDCSTALAPDREVPHSLPHLAEGGVSHSKASDGLRSGVATALSKSTVVCSRKRYPTLSQVRERMGHPASDASSCARPLRGAAAVHPAAVSGARP